MAKIPAKATEALEKAGGVRLTDGEGKFFSMRAEDKQIPFVVLKYFQGSHQCFSTWQPDELGAFTDFLRKLSQMTWPDVYKTGGSVGHKTGLGYTMHQDRSKLPNNGLASVISEEIQFFELRVTQKARVHGFRSKNAFFLVWLDRDHNIYPM